MPRIRPCTACGKRDDHPRHVFQIAPGATVFFHMDCCANNGCDTCEQQLADAKGVKGDKLRGHLIALRENAHG